MALKECIWYTIDNKIKLKSADSLQVKYNYMLIRHAGGEDIGLLH